MEPWQAIVLGLVEGITEYLPVSSTGHLILTERVLGLPNDEALRAFTIAIQGGAILAVLWLYAARVRGLLRGVVGRDREGTRLLGHLVLAFVPAAIAGLAFEDAIERVLFGLWPITAAWFVGGLVILSVPLLRDGRREGLELTSMTARHALVIGLFQCLALAPGTSRSLSTIVGALVVGLSSRAAVEFSLLLGVMTLGAATAHKSLSSGRVMLDHFGPLALALGFLTGFVAAIVAVKWLVAWLNRRGLAVFGWYRVALALVVALCLWKGVIPAS